MSHDLTNKNISDTFQNLLQKTGSDGQLYDLKGNAVEDMTIKGALHAQSYVVSKSIQAINISSGSTEFGDSIDDKHRFTGSLKVTGSVSVFDNQVTLGPSAPQTLPTGHSLAVKGHISGSGNLFVGDKHGAFMSASNGSMKISGSGPASLYVKGAITASGDISSSGNIIFGTGAGKQSIKIGGTTKLQVGTTNKFFSNLTVAGDVSSSGKYYGDGSELTGVQGGLWKNETTYWSASQDIRVSGSISSSGHITAGEDLYIRGGAGSPRIYLGPNEGHYGGMASIGTGLIIYSNGSQAPLILTGSKVGVGTGYPRERLTVSGNISASGDLYVDGKYKNNLTVDGDISASGFIKTTSHITASKIKTTGYDSLDMAEGSRFKWNGNPYHSVQAHTGIGKIMIGTNAHQYCLEVWPQGRGGYGSVGIGGTWISAPVQALEVKGNVRLLSGNVSASGHGYFGGNVYAANFLTSSIAGNLPVDGHITASGNISSSGTYISANRYDIQGSKFAAPGTGAFDFDIGQGGASSLNLTNITASGNISASGTSHHLGGTLHLANEGIAATGLMLSGSNALIQFSKELQLGVANGWNKISYGKSNSTTHIFTGAITSSGDISSSGILEADAVWCQGGRTSFRGIGSMADTIILADQTLRTHIDGKAIFLDASVTASGNISASGDLFATRGTFSGNISAPSIDSNETAIFTVNDNLKVEGNITASGNISASGNFIGNNIGIIDDNFIPILPTDFGTGDHVKGNLIRTSDLAYSVKGVAYSSNNYCTKMIPQGYTAVSASLFGTGSYRCFHSSIDSADGSTLTGNQTMYAGDTGSAFNIGVSGNGLRYISIMWNPGTANDKLHGGKIYLKKT